MRITAPLPWCDVVISGAHDVAKCGTHDGQWEIVIPGPDVKTGIGELSLEVPKSNQKMRKRDGGVAFGTANQLGRRALESLSI